MKKDLNLILTFHFHQPVDNFGFVIDKICNNSYGPLLDALADFKEIRFNMHFSGSLLEWLKEHRQDILEKVKRAVASGQAELIGGGFYEPVLSVLPQEDAVGQIESFSSFLKKEFKTEISGCWLAERVWEPHLAKTLSLAKARYTIVDDTHFRYAGLSYNELHNYYITEADGHAISLLPADMFLRFSIPFKEHDVTLNYLKKIRGRQKGGLALYADDAEKFGAWPGTHELVYKKKWLYKFLRIISKNSSWIKTSKIRDYLDETSPSGRIYVPCASYQEMNQWSLPVDFEERLEVVIDELKKKRRLSFCVDLLRGGFFKNFFVKYPESNHIHKRAIMQSDRMRELVNKRKGGKLLESARKELFKSQCNCAYWHGLFGGVYVYHLRTALFKHLLSAERILDRIEYKEKAWMQVKEEDLDCDGADEFIVSTKKDTIVIDPKEAATLTEWATRSKTINIINTLSRRKEIYHKPLKNLSYDRYRRSCFRDHFFASPSATKEEGDFYTANYIKKRSLLSKDSYMLTLEHKGSVNKQPIGVKKSFILSKNKSKLDVKYLISNLSFKNITLNFAPELNFSATEDHLSQTITDVDNIVVEDKIEDLAIVLSFSPKADKITRYPVKTISKSEKYFNEHYQATCIMPIFKLAIDKGKSKSVGISASIGEIDR